MERALNDAGYRVHNVDYDSRSASIEPLSELAIDPILATCRREGARIIHFVTHSMGGILVRSYLSRHELPELGRVVMLAPPNQGSEVVDRLGGWKLFLALNGPAGRELGTDESSTPNQLGPANFCVGIIAGNRSINWINSSFIRSANDGKVSVERTKLTGMTDHLVIQSAHPFIMRNREVLRQTVSFLQQGAFDRASEEASHGKSWDQR
jgi:hypothetical protein